MQGLTPEALEDTSFSYSMWGYKRVEVDEFVDRISLSWAESLDRARDRAYQDLGERMGQLLQHAKDAADEILRDANATVGLFRANAEVEAAALVEAANGEAADVRESARVQAQARTDEAEKRVQALGLEEAHVRERITQLRTALGDLAQQLSLLEPQTLVLPDEMRVVQTQDGHAG